MDIEAEFAAETLRLCLKAARENVSFPGRRDLEAGRMPRPRRLPGGIYDLYENLPIPVDPNTADASQWFARIRALQILGRRAYEFILSRRRRRWSGSRGPCIFCAAAFSYRSKSAAPRWHPRAGTGNTPPEGYWVCAEHQYPDSRTKALKIIRTYLVARGMADRHRALWDHYQVYGWRIPSKPNVIVMMWQAAGHHELYVDDSDTRDPELEFEEWLENQGLKESALSTSASMEKWIEWLQEAPPAKDRPIRIGYEEWLDSPPTAAALLEKWALYCTLIKDIDDETDDDVYQPKRDTAERWRLACRYYERHKRRMRAAAGHTGGKIGGRRGDSRPGGKARAHQLRESRREQREKAIKLRRQGLSVREIARAIQEPKSTVGHWTKEVKS